MFKKTALFLRQGFPKLGEDGEHGEHGEHGEQGKDGKHQPDDLSIYESKHSIYDSKHSICDSKHSIWQPDDSKHFILRLLC